MRRHAREPVRRDVMYVRWGDIENKVVANSSVGVRRGVGCRHDVCALVPGAVGASLLK